MHHASVLARPKNAAEFFVVWIELLVVVRDYCGEPGTVFALFGVQWCGCMSTSKSILPAGVVHTFDTSSVKSSVSSSMWCFINIWTVLCFAHFVSIPRYSWTPPYLGLMSPNLSYICFMTDSCVLSVFLLKIFHFFSRFMALISYYVGSSPRRSGGGSGGNLSIMCMPVRVLTSSTLCMIKYL